MNLRSAGPSEEKRELAGKYPRPRGPRTKNFLFYQVSPGLLRVPWCVFKRGKKKKRERLIRNY